jgi:hypothetical protein
MGLDAASIPRAAAAPRSVIGPTSTMRHAANSLPPSDARSNPAADSATTSTSMRRRAVCAARWRIVRTMPDGPEPATSTTESSAERGGLRHFAR